MAPLPEMVSVPPASVQVRLSPQVPVLSLWGTGTSSADGSASRWGSSDSGTEASVVSGAVVSGVSVWAGTAGSVVSGSETSGTVSSGVWVVCVGSVATVSAQTG